LLPGTAAAWLTVLAAALLEVVPLVLVLADVVTVLELELELVDASDVVLVFSVLAVLLRELRV